MLDEIERLADEDDVPSRPEKEENLEGKKRIKRIKKKKKLSKRFLPHALSSLDLNLVCV